VRASSPWWFAASVVSAALLLAGCGEGGASRTIALTTLNGSGVTGNVVLTDVGDRRTRVEVSVQDGGNHDMPAHLHPGTCANLVPQPKYPLENVRAGHSVTVVPASFAEVTNGTLALNIHRSVDDLATYTACTDIR
jgi:hypothetical protein